MFLAKTVAAEHAKNCQEDHEQQEKIHREHHAGQERNHWEAREKQERMQLDSCVNAICARINSLCDNKWSMVMQMAEPAVANNKTVLNAILNEVHGIEDEITENVEQLNSLLSMPKKNNQSPQDYHLT